ncbi:hypothetical protein B8W90_13110, partial [Staphylococcus hominis]
FGGAQGADQAERQRRTANRVDRMLPQQRLEDRRQVFADRRRAARLQRWMIDQLPEVEHDHTHVLKGELLARPDHLHAA